jgi:hypothetical protein
LALSFGASDAFTSNGKLKCIKFASNVWYIESLYVLLHRETSVAACVADEFSTNSKQIHIAKHILGNPSPIKVTATT